MGRYYKRRNYMPLFMFTRSRPISWIRWSESSSWYNIFGVPLSSFDSVLADLWPRDKVGKEAWTFGQGFMDFFISSATFRYYLKMPRTSAVVELFILQNNDAENSFLRGEIAEVILERLQLIDIILSESLWQKTFWKVTVKIISWFSFIVIKKFR